MAEVAANCRPSGHRALMGPPNSLTTVLRVLWIDDDLVPGDAILELLALEHIQVTVATTAAEGLRLAAETAYDAILLDIRLPDLFGLTALRRLRAIGVSTPVAVITGCYMEPEIEREAQRLGAADFLRKPVLDIGALANVLRSAASGPMSGAPKPVPIHGVIAASAVMQDIVSWIEAVGPRRVAVLLTGETGTGKEAIARALHASSRCRGRFVAVNCGAIPDTLFESELFGHAKGAFTGALEAKPGLIEEADGGTLFLDEIGELPPSQQARLLRVFDGEPVRRLGETRTRTPDVRVVAATNRQPRAEVAGGRFREDLYYRLSGASRNIPPLRERPEDIDALTRYWAAHHPAPDGSGPVSVAPDAMKVLRAQVWRGNVRELRNVLERAAWRLTGRLLTERHIAAALSETAPLHQGPHEAGTKRARAIAALQSAGGKATSAARLLGIDRATFYRWLGPGGRP